MRPTTRERRFTAQRLEAAACWYELLQASADPQGLIDGLLGAADQGLSYKGKPLCTVSAAAITNVSQGGSIVPTFVIEPH